MAPTYGDLVWLTLCLLACYVFEILLEMEGQHQIYLTEIPPQTVLFNTVKVWCVQQRLATVLSKTWGEHPYFYCNLLVWECVCRGGVAAEHGRASKMMV